VKNFRRQHRPSKKSLIIGKEAVIRAIESGTQLDRIYLQNNLHGKAVQEIKSLALEHNIPVNKVPVEKLNGFNISNHQGIAAQIAKQFAPTLTPEAIALVKKSGVFYKNFLPLGPGDYLVRFVIKDNLTGRTGAVNSWLKAQ